MQEMHEAVHGEEWGKEMSAEPMKKCFDQIRNGKRVYMMIPGNGTKVYGHVIAFVPAGASLKKALEMVPFDSGSLNRSVKDVSDRFPRYLIWTEESPPKLRIPNAWAVYQSKEPI